MFDFLNRGDAQVLLTAVTAVLIPFVVSWLKVVTWPTEYKFALTLVLSAVAGYLTVLVSNTFVPNGTFVQNTAIILAAAQVIYFTFFKALGLEKVIFPKAALVSAAKDVVAQNLANVDRDEAVDILDTSTPKALNVTTNVVDSAGSTSVT